MFFMIFTCTCYNYSSSEDTGDFYEEKFLKVITTAITTNQTVHEGNIAFHCNKKVIENGELLNNDAKTTNMINDQNNE